MPIKKAGAKALRQSKKRYIFNKSVSNNIKFLIKKSRKLLEAKKKTEAIESIKQAVKAIDKAAQKGIIKKNNAGRKKSRLMKRLNKI